MEVLIMAGYYSGGYYTGGDYYTGGGYYTGGYAI
jgi:hypothetical protein